MALLLECPAVVTTSIADKISSLLSDGLPQNMLVIIISLRSFLLHNRTIASLVLSSQVVIRNESNLTSTASSLRENATLNFRLVKVCMQ